jgi:alpha-ketoglutarate-dependent taurine dioxygenase
MTPDQHSAIMSAVGSVAADRSGAGAVSYLTHDPQTYAGFDATNSNPGKFDAGELLFHFDFAFNDDWPCHAISLYGLEIPPRGGDTLFVHCGLTYERLESDLKVRIEGLQLLNVFDPYRTNGALRSREAGAGRFAERGMHPIAREHPGGGKVLTPNLATTDRILGLPDDTSEALLDELFAALYASENLYRHKWSPGDFVVWDNHVVQHAREPFDHGFRRRLRRVITGDQAAIQKRVTRWKTQISDPAMIG